MRMHEEINAISCLRDCCTTRKSVPLIYKV